MFIRQLFIIILLLLTIADRSYSCSLDEELAYTPVKINRKQSKLKNIAKLVKVLEIPKILQARTIRFGDLTGDGSANLIIVQNSRKRDITHIGAFDLDLNLQWTWGIPSNENLHIPSDLPIQIYDWNNDGKQDVIFIANDKINILNGEDGSLLLENNLVNKEHRDAILIANLIAIITKSRYTSFAVYDHNLKLRYSDYTNTGHYPMAYDFDNDEIDELLIGYSLYKIPNINEVPISGSIGLVWRNRNLKRHNDAVDIGDMNNDGIPEISIAASKDGYLLSPTGKILRKIPMLHAQHTTLGYFGKSNKKQFAAYVDRQAKGIVYIADSSGRIRYKSEQQGEITIISSVKGWTGKKGQEYLLLFRRDNIAPQMINAKGRVIASFPFEPAIESRRNYGRHYAQHFDIMGDCREEIIIYNEEAIYIYSNPKDVSTDFQCETEEPLVNKRLYRASFYSGFQ